GSTTMSGSASTSTCLPRTSIRLPRIQVACTTGPAVRASTLVTCMSDSSERAFYWRDLEPLPRPAPRIRADIRPDRAARPHLESRAQCFLGKWYRDLAGMPVGSGRHNAVRSKARAAGGLVASGLLSEQQAYEALYAACEANGLTQDPGGAADKTVRDGLE